MSLSRILLFAMILVILAPTNVWAGGSRRPERLIAVKLKVQHAYRCTACAARVAEILRKQDGVRDARAIAAQDAAVVIFASGKGSVDEMREALKLAGFVTQMTWGPSAVKLDGRYEETPLNEISHKQPTLKELQALEAAKTPAKAFQKTSRPKTTRVYVPLKSEALPVPTE